MIGGPVHKTSVIGSQYYFYVSYQPGRVLCQTEHFPLSTESIMLVLQYYSAPMTVRLCQAGHIAKGNHHVQMCMISPLLPVSLVFSSSEACQRISAFSQNGIRFGEIWQRFFCFLRWRCWIHVPCAQKVGLILLCQDFSREQWRCNCTFLFAQILQLRFRLKQ